MPFQIKIKSNNEHGLVVDIGNEEIGSRVICRRFPNTDKKPIIEVCKKDGVNGVVNSSNIFTITQK